METNKLTMPRAARPFDVLIAEDNPVNQFLLIHMLKRLGLSYRIANNGAEAIEAYRSATPDLILMDVQMPVMDGLNATREVRKLEEKGGFRVPIIAVTANAFDSDVIECVNSGMDDYMSKPVRADLLRSKLTEWIGRNHPDYDLQP
jgi:CheY-like chemotaxis protein